jgi:hypothetical protein
VTGDVGPAALQRNAIAAMMNVLVYVIAASSYRFVIAVYRAKEHNPPH